MRAGPWRRPALGLRVRLLLAFALLSTVTAAAVAGVGYVRARDAIVVRAQDNAVIETTDRIEQLYPLSSTPDPAALLEIAGAVAGRTGSGLAETAGGRAGTLDPAVVSPELRAAVDDGRVAWQRVAVGGGTQLVIGTQLRLSAADPDAPPRPSGITVYVCRPLSDETAAVAALARDAWLTGAAALLFAMLLALLAARGVLRPVRDLLLATRRLGAGDLGARVPVREGGGDELAAVARAFNVTAGSLGHHVGELHRMEADARRFVGDVSHELRTPLAAMSAVTDVLDAEADRLPDVTGAAVQLVARETRNLTRLVDDLIEVARFDAGRATVTLDEIDVAAAVRATLAVRGLTDAVTATLPDGVRARLDPRRLDVIVANLVGNAVRHGAPPVSLRLTSAADEFVLEVTDHGPGLDAEVLPHVFDRFYKADTARSRSAGSGLGLAIARENARLHGGTLTAANRPGGGAVFTLTLPLDQGRVR